MLRVNPHGGEYVVRRIPTGVDKVCEGRDEVGDLWPVLMEKRFQ